MENIFIVTFKNVENKYPNNFAWFEFEEEVQDFMHEIGKENVIEILRIPYVENLTQNFIPINN